MSKPTKSQANLASAEAKFKKKQLAAELGSEARIEYAAGQKAALDRMAGLKELRLAREAAEKNAAELGTKARASKPKGKPPNSLR